jgi:hypothetical protein
MNEAFPRCDAHQHLDATTGFDGGSGTSGAVFTSTGKLSLPQPTALHARVRTR